jgi:hypothetical protein
VTTDAGVEAKARDLFEADHPGHCWDAAFLRPGSGVEAASPEVQEDYRQRARIALAAHGGGEELSTDEQDEADIVYRLTVQASLTLLPDRTTEEDVARADLMNDAANEIRHLRSELAKIRKATLTSPH